MRIQFVRRSKRCALPQVAKYGAGVPFKGDFEDLEIKDPDNFKIGPIRPEGNRQPAAEAVVLGNVRARAQGITAFPDADVERGGYR